MPITRQRSAIIIFSIATALVLLAYSSDRAAHAQPHAIAIEDSTFQPGSVAIDAGDTVTWTNHDSIEHTVTSTSGAWDSGPIAEDATFSYTFTIPGTYAYICDFHETMTGTITVQPQGPTKAFLPLIFTSEQVPVIGAGRHIAFTASFPGNGDIYIADVDGSNPVQLTFSDAHDYDATWGPSGKQLAFTAELRNSSSGVVKSSIQLLNDRASPITLTVRVTPDFVGDPAWSPDGSRIAFTCSGQVCVMNADGSEQRQITQQPGENIQPAWAPGSNRIVFSSNRDGNRQLYFMDADGSNQQRLTNNTVEDTDPAWSPDGTRIAFSRNGTSIYILNIDGRTETLLVSEPLLDALYGVAWSPDSQQLAYSHAIYKSIGISLINPDGSDKRRFEVDTDERGYHEYPAWSPD